MNRAEMRRLKKKTEKAEQKIATERKESIARLKNHGVNYDPQAITKAGPARIKGLTRNEVSALTGIDAARLECWVEEEKERMKRGAIREAQEKLDRIEDHLVVSNMLTALESLNGFRYAKAAAQYMTDHYSEAAASVAKKDPKEVYRTFKEKYGVDLGFDVPEMNELLGIDIVDWRLEYIGSKVPVSVIDKIADDQRTIQNALNILASFWALCEGFGFHKHPDASSNKMNKFIELRREKYKLIEADEENGIRNAAKTLKEKYGFTVQWTEHTDKVLKVFGLI